MTVDVEHLTGAGLHERLVELAGRGIGVWVPDPGLSTAGRTYLGTLIDGGRAPAVVPTLRLPRPTGWRLGVVRTEFTAGSELTLSPGIVFGGYQTALADHLAGLAMMTVLSDGYDFVTSAIRTEFAAPLTPGAVIAESAVVEASRRFATVRVRIEQDGVDRTIADVEQVVLTRTAMRPGAPA